jgi:hypothetical protein
MHSRLTAAVVLVLVIGLAALAGPATAAAPVAGGRYVAECCRFPQLENHFRVADLRVAADGRTLTRRSYVGCESNAFFLNKFRPPRSVRIRREGRSDGSFSFQARRRSYRGGYVTVRARGRFTSAGGGWFRYSVRPTKRSHCQPGPVTVGLHLDREPPFSGCGAQSAWTYVATSNGLVFEQHRVLFGWSFLPITYGCLYSVNERFALGLNGVSASGLGQLLSHFRLAGPYAAYGCQGNTTDVEVDGARIAGCVSALYVTDLRDGSRREVKVSGGQFRGGGVEDLELKENGSVAWIESAFERGSRTVEQVGALDTTGQRVLDRGFRIERNSLTLTGSTLSWINAGQARSAVLN